MRRGYGNYCFLFRDRPEQSEQSWLFVLEIRQIFADRNVWKYFPARTFLLSPQFFPKEVPGNCFCLAPTTVTMHYCLDLENQCTSTKNTPATPSSRNWWRHARTRWRLLTVEGFLEGWINLGWKMRWWRRRMLKRNAFFTIKGRGRTGVSFPALWVCVLGRIIF